MPVFTFSSSQAFSLMQELRQNVASVNMSFYVNTRTIEVIYKALDVPVDRSILAENKVMLNGDAAGASEDEGELLAEEVEEDVDNVYD